MIVSVTSLPRTSHLCLAMVLAQQLTAETPVAAMPFAVSVDMTLSKPQRAGSQYDGH